MKYWLHSMYVGIAIAATPVSAQKVRVTLTGTVGAGFIADNYMAEGATSLVGLPFTAIWDVDGDTPGAQNLIDDYPELTTTVTRGDAYEGSVSPVSARIIIGDLVDRRLDGREGGYNYAYGDRMNPQNDGIGMAANESLVFEDGNAGGFLNFTFYNLLQGSTTGYWWKPLDLVFNGDAGLYGGSAFYEISRYDAEGNFSLYYMNADFVPARLTMRQKVSAIHVVC